MSRTLSAAALTAIAAAALLSSPALAEEPFELGQCDGEVSATMPKSTVNPATRDAAQSSLDFLAADTIRWQNQHNCYGCHVQAVTLSALAVGESNQYEVARKDVDEVISGITDLPGGSRTQGGLRYSHGGLESGARTLGGAAFAAYDELVGNDLTKDLMQTAEQLLAMRDTRGAITNPYENRPVATGTLQETVLSMATWNQAYARTADDQWLTAVALAENYLRDEVNAWSNVQSADIQAMNYALQGFSAAGTGATEPVVGKLVRALEERQNEDGGWSLSTGNTTSDAYATGQTVYTLRLMGRPDDDPTVSKGTDWLISHQSTNGSWSTGGAARAEAMWGVLGLVSVDVLTLSVEGLANGQHVDDLMNITAEAFDNQGGKVSKVEISIDDIPAFGECGSTMSYGWNTTGLEPGMHLVDVSATNSQGKTARRRFNVYAGPVYLTRLGSKWDDGGTIVSFRNIAPDSYRNSVRFSVWKVDNQDQPVELLLTQQASGLQGPQAFFWNGVDAQGEAQPRARYLARVEMLGADTKVVQTLDHVFVHATQDEQTASYGAIGGQINFGSGAATENAMVELVDDEGRVVARSATTAAGRYRFKNVRDGRYTVRAKKDGYAVDDMAVDAAAGEESEAPAALAE